jgi:hypothetical protein
LEVSNWQGRSRGAFIRAKRTRPVIGQGRLGRGSPPPKSQKAEGPVFPPGLCRVPKR